MGKWINIDDLPSGRVKWDDIFDAPSIDLVRCKECKYKRIYDGETKYYYCALEDRPNRQWSIDEMDYCSWAEREDE